MFRDITIGQYYRVESPIHRLDARTKIMITLLFSISIFLCDSLWAFGVATIFLVGYVAASRVPVLFIVRGLKVIFFFILFTAIFSIFNGTGDVVFAIWRLKITTGSIRTTALVSFRLIYLIVGSSIMTYTTMPITLTGGLEHLLAWMKVFHVPVSEIAMMLSITLRFIPILMEELNKIIKAQISRGADFESGNIFKKIKCSVPVLIPIFVSAMRRAVDLAQAMDARCFNGTEGRTRMTPLKYQAIDILAFCILAIYVILIVVFKVRT